VEVDPVEPFSTVPIKINPTSPAASLHECDRNKRVNVMEEDKQLDQGENVDKIFTMLTKLAPLIQKLEYTDLGSVKVIQEQVEKLDGELERVKREHIATNVIILGALEKQDETHEEMQQQVEKVFRATSITGGSDGLGDRLRASPGSSR
jgi:hypothetical protein